MNTRRLMYKLQTALCANGKRIKIDQHQYWSEKAGRMVTIYEARDESDKTICKAYKPIDVVYALAKLLNNGGDAA